MRKAPWYKRYEEYRDVVMERKAEFVKRSEALGVTSDQALREFSGDIIARAVHESNWNEGLWLDEQRTRELAEVVFKDAITVQGPHLNMQEVLDQHRQSLVELQRQNATVEEIAAYNLSRAHVAIHWIGLEFAGRKAARLLSALSMLDTAFQQLDESRRDSPVRVKLRKDFQEVRELIQEFLGNTDPVPFPLTPSFATKGELVRDLMTLDMDALRQRMRVEYLHFLHRVVLMGIRPPHETGVFRDIAVAVGDPDLIFPAPSLVPEMMAQYCRDFTPVPLGPDDDAIWESARFSHRFVRIHPYVDGNGRMSRLLMNLILWSQHPPAVIKADPKGRKRYGYALRRGNGGDYAPMAALIAMSLIDVYDRILDAMRAGESKSRS